MRLVVVLAMLLLVMSVWAGTFKDDFEDGNTDGWRLMKSFQAIKYSVENGELVSTSQSICNLGSPLIAGKETWGDFVFECQFKIEQTFAPGCAWPAVIGLGLYGEDANGGSAIESWIYSEGAKDWSLKGSDTINRGNIQVLNQENLNFTIKNGEWYNGRMVIDGNRYTAFIDDQLICDQQFGLLDREGPGILAKNCRRALIMLSSQVMIFLI